MDMDEKTLLKEFARKLIRSFKTPQELILTRVKNPHDLERVLEIISGRKAYHFWEPSSPYGVIVIDGIGKVAWILGDRYEILKKFKPGDMPTSEGIGDILSGAFYKDNVLRMFKRKY